ncbi:MAG: LLM class F420-dependent oxidoreductase [Frankia sp.]
MKIDTNLGGDITKTKESAQALAAAGYDGLWIGETSHDPFLQCLQAAEATTDVTIGTSIAVAFARTPMTLANLGYDLAQYSGGRFVLGLGSQVKPHIERRFSMPWSHPAARMRELIVATKAIWTAWQDGTKLDFAGDFYTHTLMTPFFTPAAHSFGPPPIYLAGVGDRMTEVAGEVADGFFIHPFTTRRYLDEVTLPALARGRARAGRTMDGFTICGPSFVTTGRDEAEMAVAVAATKKQIAFYASTPSYRSVLERHGWSDLQPELSSLARADRWDDMGALIDEDMLTAFSVVAPPDRIAPALREKLADIATRLTFYAPYQAEPALWATVRTALR